MKSLATLPTNLAEIPVRILGFVSDMSYGEHIEFLAEVVEVGDKEYYRTGRVLLDMYSMPYFTEEDYLSQDVLVRECDVLWHRDLLYPTKPWRTNKFFE